ncbi:porin [Variovorax sp. KK3]|uniref:porin n=1 Tax=Variovorax sp. KK3 TaxID=1855728 RepID=UPI00097C851F|nr:porin [Variovorax sp. KK3]
MRQLLTAASALCVMGSAVAQSSVTVYGVVDTAFSRGTGSGLRSTSTERLTSGGTMASRFGFRGVEDLGGGWGAGFWLESQIFSDTGEGQATNTNNQPSGTTTAPAGSQGFTFARRSTVSLLGPYGELRVGRDFTAHYRNRLEIDPFGNAGVGSIQPFAGSIAGVTSTRASNMIGYFLPANLGGFYGQVQHYFGENARQSGTANAQADDGTGDSARLGWAGGGLNVSLAAARTRYARTATLGDITVMNAGVTYDFGFAKLLAGYYRDKVDATTPIKARGTSLGTIIPVGVGEIKVAISRYGTDARFSPETSKLSLGYVHYLSKRTALYGTYARVRNSGGATTGLNGAITAANQPSSGFDLGIRHQF